MREQITISLSSSLTTDKYLLSSDRYITMEFHVKLNQNSFNYRTDFFCIVQHWDKEKNSNFGILREEIDYPLASETTHLLSEAVRAFETFKKFMSDPQMVNDVQDDILNQMLSLATS